MNSSTISDDYAVALLAAAAAIEDTKNELWSAELVKRAAHLWMKGRGRVPSFSEVTQEIGVDRSKLLLQQVLAERKLRNQLLGYRSPCHYCGSDSELIGFDFGLLRVSSSSIAWKESAISAVVGLGTFPLLGAAFLRLPSKSHNGEALALKLIVCKACRKKNANLFGLFTLNESRAQHQPMWSILHELGFTKFLNSESMPIELKLSSTLRL